VRRGAPSDIGEIFQYDVLHDLSAPQWSEDDVSCECFAIHNLTCALIAEEFVSVNKGTGLANRRFRCKTSAPQIESKMIILEI
jgi:hypothetical protein